MQNQKVDVRRFEAPENFTTILRVLDIENIMVFNTLVDYLSLENTLLIESDDEARHLMQTYVNFFSKLFKKNFLKFFFSLPKMFVKLLL